MFMDFLFTIVAGFYLTCGAYGFATFNAFITIVIRCTFCTHDHLGLVGNKAGVFTTAA